MGVLQKTLRPKDPGFYMELGSASDYIVPRGGLLVDVVKIYTLTRSQ